MNKKFLKQLVLASYTDRQLDEEKIEKIIQFLKRKDLKTYIKGLRARERQLTVFIDSPDSTVEKNYHQTFESLFPQKRVYFGQDPTLLLGIKVTENDIVLDLSLQNRFVQLKQYIEETL